MLEEALGVPEPEAGALVLDEALGVPEPEAGALVLEEALGVPEPDPGALVLEEALGVPEPDAGALVLPEPGALELVGAPEDPEPEAGAVELVGALEEPDPAAGAFVLVGEGVPDPDGGALLLAGAAGAFEPLEDETGALAVPFPPEEAGSPPPWPELGATLLPVPELVGLELPGLEAVVDEPAPSPGPAEIEPVAGAEGLLEPGPEEGCELELPREVVCELVGAFAVGL